MAASSVGVGGEMRVRSSSPTFTPELAMNGQNPFRTIPIKMSRIAWSVKAVVIEFSQSDESVRLAVLPTSSLYHLSRHEATEARRQKYRSSGRLLGGRSFPWEASAKRAAH